PIESQGFYFAAIVVGVKRGWITRKDGYRRAVITLKTLKKLKHIRGFYYHFIDPETGRRGWNDSHGVELSNASSGTMIMGALIAGEYFGGEVKALAEDLYARMDWNWFTDPKKKHPYLACFPEDKPRKEPPGGMNEEGFFGGWAAYSEHIFLYVLGAGAPDPGHATDAAPYYAMITYRGRYRGEEFIFCGTGAAFTYQWTHAFVDFRNLDDKLGRNWFENSRHAAIAARRYAIDRADEIRGLGPNSWGMSACMSPSTFYSGRYGSKPIGAGYSVLEDGTVAPYGSSAFVVFTPKESIEALEYMYTIPGLAGKYGLYDAYSFMTKNDGNKPWIGKSYLGIDKGLVLLMFENYSTQLIWKLFHQSKHVQKGLRVLEFKHVARRRR
ncbi:MAG: glucoamylase family protein, partial [Planctomycetota bacterium]|nr:glucoamylase family protein [Planctomycetota bacterium]